MLSPSWKVIVSQKTKGLENQTDMKPPINLWPQGSLRIGK